MECGAWNAARSGSEFAEMEFVAREAEVFDDVGDDPARHVAGMPGNGDEAFGLERIGVMPVAARSTEQFTADFPEAALQLPAVVARVFAHGSGGEDELVAKGRWDRPARFQERFQVDLGSLLKTQCGLAAVAPVCVAARQEVGFRNPHAVFILTELHFRKRNDHSGTTVARPAAGVKRAFDA